MVTMPIFFFFLRRNKTSAEKLLIKGFFNEVISEDGWETISDKVSEEIMQKYLNVLERSK